MRQSQFVPRGTPRRAPFSPKCVLQVMHMIAFTGNEDFWRSIKRLCAYRSTQAGLSPGWLLQQGPEPDLRMERKRRSLAYARFVPAQETRLRISLPGGRVPDTIQAIILVQGVLNCKILKFWLRRRLVPVALGGALLGARRLPFEPRTERAQRRPQPADAEPAHPGPTRSAVAVRPASDSTRSTPRAALSACSDAPPYRARRRLTQNKTPTSASHRPAPGLPATCGADHSRRLAPCLHVAGNSPLLDFIAVVR